MIKDKDIEKMLMKALKKYPDTKKRIKYIVKTKLAIHKSKET